MAIAFVAEAHNTQANASTAFSVNVPAGTIDGMLMLACYHCDGGTGDPNAPTAPSGWTFLRKDGAVGGSPPNPGAYVRTYWHVAASEPTSYSWTTPSIPGAQTSYLLVLTYSGVDTTTPWDATATGASIAAAVPDSPSITTATANAWVLSVASRGQGTVPSGMTLDYDAGATAYPSVAHILRASTGAYDPAAWGTSITRGGAQSHAIRPGVPAVVGTRFGRHL